jgi:hemoglobin
MVNSVYSDEELKYWVALASKEFYELVYKDDWLSQVFAVVPQEFITNQQSDFMLGLLGGPKVYSGRNAKDAHPHIFVDEEMWQLRESLLIKAFDKIQFPNDLRQKWLKIDEAFKHSIVMKDPSECKKRFTSDEIIYIPSPYKKSA